MTKKLGKILLVTGSIAAVSAIIGIGYKKLINSMEVLKFDEAEEKESDEEYIILNTSKVKKDPTISAIERAGQDQSNMDE